MTAPRAPHLPLAGRRVLVPRAPAQAATLSARISDLGGEPVVAPVLLIEPGDSEALAAAVRDLAAGAFALVCLTSPNGVDAVADAFEVAGLDARALGGARTVACVGPGTAAALWERLRVRADLVPGTATTEALAQAAPPPATPGGRALLARADIATNRLADGLARSGWEVTEVTAYRTTAPEALDDDVLAQLAAGEIDLVPFASASTAVNFAALVDGRPWSAAVVSIGPVTSATCAELGITVDVEADPHDLDGLVEALVSAATTR